MGNFGSILRNQIRPSYIATNASYEPLLDNEREKYSEKDREKEKQIPEDILIKISKMESDIINLLDSQKNLKEYVNFLAEQNKSYEKEIMKLHHNQTIMSEILSLENYRV